MTGQAYAIYIFSRVCGEPHIGFIADIFGTDTLTTTKVILLWQLNVFFYI